jgi:hypothetical protein
MTGGCGQMKWRLCRTERGVFGEREFAMKIRISAVVMILACGIIVGAERNAVTTKQYQIDVTMVDESTMPEINRQHFAVVSEGTIHLHDGGEFRADHDGAGLQFGRKVDGSIKEIERGVTRIELTVEISHKVASDDARTQIVVGDVLKIQTDMNVGETKRIHCGEQRYCVLRLD